MGPPLSRELDRLREQFQRSPHDPDLFDALGRSLDRGGHHPELLRVLFGSRRHLTGDWILRLHSLLRDQLGVLSDPTLEVGSYPLALALSPDGEVLAVGEAEGHISLFDASTGLLRVRRQVHSQEVRTLAFAPQGDTLFSGSLDCRWRASRTSDLRLLQEGARHRKSIQDLRISPDGSWILTASSDTTMRTWDLATGRETRRLSGSLFPIQSCDISPDAHWLASASLQRTCILWDATRGVERVTMHGHLGWVSGCRFSPDGESLLSGDTSGEVRLWEVPSGSPRGLLAKGNAPIVDLIYPEPQRALALTKTGDLIEVFPQSGLPPKVHSLGLSGTCLLLDAPRHRLVLGSRLPQVKLHDFEAKDPSDLRPSPEISPVRSLSQASANRLDLKRLETRVSWYQALGRVPTGFFALRFDGELFRANLECPSASDPGLTPVASSVEAISCQKDQVAWVERGPQRLELVWDQDHRLSLSDPIRREGRISSLTFDPKAEEVRVSLALERSLARHEVETRFVFLRFAPGERVLRDDPPATERLGRWRIPERCESFGVTPQGALWALGSTRTLWFFAPDASVGESLSGVLLAPRSGLGEPPWLLGPGLVRHRLEPGLPAWPFPHSLELPPKADRLIFRRDFERTEVLWGATEAGELYRWDLTQGGAPEALDTDPRRARGIDALFAQGERIVLQRGSVLELFRTEDLTAPKP